MSKKERRNTMIYLNSDRTEFIDSDAFIACGNEVREGLNREYHAPTAQELYDFIDSQPTWDSVPTDAYDQLADLCGVGYTEEDGPDTLMDRCAAALEKQASQYVQDEDGRTVDYAAAVELMDDDLREQLHMELAPCTNQEFFDAYVKAHAEKFNGEKFQN